MTVCIVRAPKPDTHQAASSTQSTDELNQMRHETADSLADTLAYALQDDADPAHVVREIREALAPYEGSWSAVDQLRFIFKDGSTIPAAHAAVAGIFDLRALALSAVALIDTGSADEEVVRVLSQLAVHATNLATAVDAAAVKGGAA